MSAEVNNLELLLLSGSPINISDICLIYPLKLKEIKEIGETTYNQHLSLLLLNKKTIDVTSNKITDYEAVLALCYHDKMFRLMYLSAMNCFLKESVSIHENGFFYLGNYEDNRFIDEKVFTSIREVLIKQNFIDNKTEQEFRPANEKARELYEKMKQVKNKIQKDNVENGLNLSDIISIVSCYSNVDMFKIWELTIYQLYTLYIRLIMKDNYETQLFMLPHISNSNSSDIKHWASKLNK